MVFANRLPERRTVRKQLKSSVRNLRDFRYEHLAYLIEAEHRESTDFIIAKPRIVAV